MALVSALDISAENSNVFKPSYLSLGSAFKNFALPPGSIKARIGSYKRTAPLAYSASASRFRPTAIGIPF